MDPLKMYFLLKMGITIDSATTVVKTNPMVVFSALSPLRLQYLLAPTLSMAGAGMTLCCFATLQCEPTDPLHWKDCLINALHTPPPLLQTIRLLTCNTNYCTYPCWPQFRCLWLATALGPWDLRAAVIPGPKRDNSNPTLRFSGVCPF